VNAEIDSDHSEQDRPNEGERSDDREYVNPTGEKHGQSPLLVALYAKAASRRVPWEAQNRPGGPVCGLTPDMAG